MAAAVDHPNVVRFVGFCVAPPCLATEYCPLGSMQDILSRATSRAASPVGALTWRRLVAMAADAAAGMAHLHARSPPVLHRDLKSSNLLVGSDWTVKVSDYVTCPIVEAATRAQTVVPGTQGRASDKRWLAPEVMEGRTHSPTSDVYSFGIVLWEVLTWQLPWANVNPWGIVGLVLSGARPLVPSPASLPSVQGGRPRLEEYSALMQRCWAVNPEERPDFEEIHQILKIMVAGM